MQTTTVSMRLSELMYGGLEKVKKIVDASTLEDDPIILISVSLNENEAFFEKLGRRMSDLERGKGITFTMDELEKYIASSAK